MNEKTTKDLPGRKSFEARVFARFDAVDARLEKLESRSYDTKPIWERALKAILDTGLEVGEVKNKVDAIEKRIGGIEKKGDAIENKVDAIENKVDGIETRVGGIETRVGVIENDIGSIKANYAEIKRDLKHQVNRRIELILEFLLEGRDDIRDAENRIKELESKLA